MAHRRHIPLAAPPALNPPGIDGTVRCMRGRVLVLIMLSGCSFGCAAHAQRAPAVNAPVAQEKAAPAHSGILEQAGDATWGVITTPARIVAGAGNKPKPQEPQQTLPPAAFISPRSTDEGQAASTP